MPKLPPPPRTAQNRSGSAASLTVTRRPSAVTRSTSTRLSIVRPCLRASQPMPPPRVRPPRPTEPVSPNGVAKPCCPAAARVLAGGRAALGGADPADRVDVDRAHRAQVDQHAAVGRRVAGDAVAAALDRDLEAELAGGRRRRARRRRRSRAARSRAGWRSRSGCCGCRGPRRSPGRRRRGRDPSIAARIARRSDPGTARARGGDRRAERGARAGRRGRRRGPASRSSPWTFGWVGRSGAIGDLILAGPCAGATGRAMPVSADGRWASAMDE